MRISDYQVEAIKTARQNTDNLLNGALGLCGEAGEVADLIKKHKFQGHKLDNEKLLSELGDVMWYIALLCTTTGIKLEDVMENNIKKLRRRYPSGFSSDRSINRDE